MMSRAQPSLQVSEPHREVRFRYISEKEKDWIYHDSQKTTLPEVSVTTRGTRVCLLVGLFMVDHPSIPHVNKLTCETPQGDLENGVFSCILKEDKTISLKLGVKIFAALKKKEDKVLEKKEFQERCDSFKISKDARGAYENVDRHQVCLRILLLDEHRDELFCEKSFTIVNSNGPTLCDYAIAHRSPSSCPADGGNEKLILVCPKLKKGDWKVCFREYDAEGNVKFKKTIHHNSDECKLFGTTTIVLLKIPSYIAERKKTDIHQPREVFLSVEDKKSEPDYKALKQAREQGKDNFLKYFPLATTGASLASSSTGSCRSSVSTRASAMPKEPAVPTASVASALVSTRPRSTTSSLGSGNPAPRKMHKSSPLEAQDKGEGGVADGWTFQNGAFPNPGSIRETIFTPVHLPVISGEAVNGFFENSIVPTDPPATSGSTTALAPSQFTSSPPISSEGPMSVESVESSLKSLSLGLDEEAKKALESLSPEELGKTREAWAEGAKDELLETCLHNVSKDML